MPTKIFSVSKLSPNLQKAIKAAVATLHNSNSNRKTRSKKQLTSRVISKTNTTNSLNLKNVKNKSLASSKGAYWNNEGDYQEWYERIRKQYIPAQGSAKTLAAELVRSASNLYYDYHNNEWGNVKLKEAKLLLENVNLFSPYYNGTATELKSILRDLVTLQELIAESQNAGFSGDESYDPFEEAQDFIANRAPRLINPYLDKIVDAIVQYAYTKLFLNS